jgi:hypothetical protein
MKPYKLNDHRRVNAANEGEKGKTASAIRVHSRVSRAIFLVNPTKWSERQRER